VTVSAPADPVVPAWLRRTGAIGWRLLAIAALAAVTLWLSVVLGTVTMSILVALVVAASFAPMVGWLRARGWSASAASAAATAAFFVIGFGAILVVLLWLAPELLGMLGSIQAGVDEMRAGLEAISIPPAVGVQIAEVVDGVRAWLEAGLGGIVAGVASVVTVAILALFLTYFTLADGERAWAWLLQITTDAKRQRIDAAGRDALERVGGYLRGTGLLSAARAAAYAAFLWALGVPYVLPLAVFVLLGGFIPYIGPFLAMAAVLLVALGTVGVEATLVLFVLMLIANGVVNNFLRPIVYGRSVHLHPAIILITIPAGAAVAGIVGVFAAVPVTAFGAAIGGALIDALEPDSGPRPDRLVAGWVDRLAQWSWRLLAAIGVVAVGVLVIVQAPMVVIPVVLAFVVAASVAPVADAFRRRGWGRGRAAAVAVGGTFLIVLLLVAVALAQLAGPMREGMDAAIAGADELRNDAGGTLAWVHALAVGIGALLTTAAGLLEALAAIGVALLLSALLSFYFLRDGGRGWASVVSRASEWRRDPLHRIGRDTVGILGGYMFGTAAISAVGAVSQLVIMLVLDLPFAIPIAVLSFILCFIPYYGGFVTTGLAFLIAVGYGTPTQIAIMFVYTIIFNIVQGNIVTPLVYNRAVNLHPAVVLLAIPAGGALAGIPGMFLAVPILAVVATSWRTVLYLMGDRPAVRSEPVVVSDAAEGSESAVENLSPQPAD
jgi:predicted PurR-regulated permease PerM